MLNYVPIYFTAQEGMFFTGTTLTFDSKETNYINTETRDRTQIYK